jgi:hypothetical protein
MEVRGADDIERAFERLPTRSEQGLIVFPHFITVQIASRLLDWLGGTAFQRSTVFDSLPPTVA